MPRPWYEERGFTSAWYAHRYMIRTERLSLTELVRLARMHGDKCLEELRIGIACPNHRMHGEVLACLYPADKTMPTPPDPRWRQASLF